MVNDITKIPFNSWNTPNLVYWIEKVPSEIRTEDIPIILGAVRRLDDVSKCIGINLFFKELSNAEYVKRMIADQKATLSQKNFEWFESELLAAHNEIVQLKQGNLKSLIRRILNHSGMIVFSIHEQRDFVKEGLDYDDIAKKGLENLANSNDEKTLEYMRIIGEIS